MSTRRLMSTHGYDELFAHYRWLVPANANLAYLCCRRWVENPGHARLPAVIALNAHGEPTVWSFSRLQQMVDRLCHGLARMGVTPGSHVALLLAASPEAVAAHLALYQMGAVAVPLPSHAAPALLEQRLRAVRPVVAFFDSSSHAAIQAMTQRRALPDRLIAVGLRDERAVTLDGLLARQPNERYPDLLLPAEAPAQLMFTSGHRSASRAVLLPHGALIGNLPGFVATQNWFPDDSHLFWSGLDWSHWAGLLQGLLPTLYFGRPILTIPGRPVPERLLQLLAQHRVTHGIVSAYQLATWRDDLQQPPAAQPWRALAVTADQLDPDVVTWSQQTLGVTPNGLYGQTETGGIVGDSHTRWTTEPGSLGRAIPGHHVGVLGSDDQPLPDGSIGELALAATDGHGHPDPARALGYWQDGTLEPLAPWHRTGDIGWRDTQGQLWRLARVADTLEHQGQAYSPRQLERILETTPWVRQAAVIARAQPDAPARVRAYIVPAAGFSSHPPAYLSQQIRDVLRHQLPDGIPPPDEYEFIDWLPRSDTGVILRQTLRQKIRPARRRRTTVPTSSS